MIATASRGYILRAMVGAGWCPASRSSWPRSAFNLLGDGLRDVLDPKQR